MDANEGTGGMSEDDAVGPVPGSHACELSAELSWWIFSHGEWEERRGMVQAAIPDSPMGTHGRKVPRNRSQALSRLQG